MIPPRRNRGYTTLKRASSMPVWLSIGWRVLIVLALVGIAVAVHWFDREGLRDNYDGHVSFTDVIYFTMISITTTGYGDIAPVADRARLFDALIVTPIRVFVILLFVGTAYSFVFRRTWDKWRMTLIQRNLHNHIVVAGFGVSNSEAVDELIARGTDPAEIVVVDCDHEALERAEALGCNVLQGDATRDQTLMDIKIDRARSAHQRDGQCGGQRTPRARGGSDDGDQPGQLRRSAAGGFMPRPAYRRISRRSRSDRWSHRAEGTNGASG